MNCYGYVSVLDATHKKAILLLLILLSYTAAESLLSTDARLPIVVESGKSTYLTVAHLPIDPKLKVADLCQVEVDDNQPLSGAVGFFKPKKFPCFYEPNTVSYQHEGSPLLTSDTVIVNIYFFRKHYSMVRNVTIQISIIAPKTAPRVLFKTHLSVGSSKGISEALSSEILTIKYNYRKEYCRMKHYNQAAASSIIHPWVATRYWPLTGLLITFNKSKVYEFNMDCQQALLMGYRFMHRRTRGPTVDFLPLVVEISDIEKKVVIDTTYLQIPIIISSSTSSDLFKNLLPPPVVETFRTVKLKNFGGTISLLPKDILEVRSQDKNRGPLIAKIVAIHGNDIAKFVNMRDPSKAIWSFVLSDLMDGLIGFQLMSYSETMEKIFRVDLTICDSYFVYSEPLILKIVDELDNKNQPFQVYTTPFFTYTGNVRQLKNNNIQVVGEIDHSLIRYRVLSINTTYGSLNKLPLLDLHSDSADNSKYFNIEDIKSSLIFYRHNGGLDGTDLIRLEASIDRFRFIRFLLPIHIVRVYNRSKDMLLKSHTELLTPTEGIMPLPLLRLVNWLYFYNMQRDNMDIFLTLVKEPRHGTLIKLFPWENVTESSTLNGSLSITDLINGLIFFNSNPSSSNNRDVVEFQQVGRLGHDTSILSFNIKFYVTNFLIPKMDRNIMFKVLETSQYARLSYLNLNFVNNNLRPKDVVYRITRCPTYDQSESSFDAGRLVSLKNIQNHLLIGDTVLTTKITNYRSAQITSVIEFTQQQIMDNDIVYIPPVDDIGPKDRLVEFLYSVKDSYGYEIRNVPFTILVKAVNNKAPVVRTSVITVARDEEVFMTKENIDIDDVDTNVDDLRAEVVQLPTYGDLINERNVVVGNGSIFGAAKLMERNIRYKHNGRNVKEDRFKIRIFDGVQYSPTYIIMINITKRVLSNSTWNLYINNSVIVNENQTVVLHENAFQNVMKNFDYNLYSNPTFILVAMPTRGNLIKDDYVISSFFYEEVKNSKIKYQHTSTEIGSKAQFDFTQIWILESGLSFNMNFTIVPVNSQAPLLYSQTPLQVNEGGFGIVSYYTLSVVDLDSKESDVMVKVIRPPIWGKICLKLDRKLVNKFSVSDIRLGKILYVNSRYLNGLEQTSDIFTVQAFDQEFSSPQLDVPVVIHPTNDEIPDLVLRDFNIAVNENRTLNENIFHVADADIPRDVLQISVTMFPRFGHLITLYKHGEVKKITKDSPPLTLQMLKFMSLLYVQNNDSIDLVKIKFPQKDMFELMATDGKHKVFKNCAVNITGFNRFPPVLFTSLLQLDKIAEKNLTELELRVKDEDTLPEDIIFTVLSPPKLGILFLGKSPLKSSDMFSQRNIIDLKVKYKYTGKAVSYAPDSIVLKAFDGSFETNSKIVSIFMIQPIQKPKMIISFKPIKIDIGRRFVLDPSILRIENPLEEVLKSLVVTVTKRPTCGSLYDYKNLETPITKFPFVDLETRKIIFFISDCPEVVKFMNIPISLGYQNKFEQKALINVELIPRSNMPPVLEQNIAVETVTGSNVVLTKKSLLLKDQESPSDKIVFKYLKTNDSMIKLTVDDVETITFTQYDINSQKVVINVPDDHNSSSTVLPLHVSDGDNEGYIINGNHQLNGIVNLTILITNWIHKDLILLRYSAPKEMKFVDGFNAFAWTFHNILVSRPDAKIVSAVDLAAGFFYNILTKKSVKVFSQIDINKGWIYYFLHKERSSVIYKEIFQFKIHYEEFRISSESLTVKWSIIEFDKTKYKICPQRGLLSIDVLRKGDLSVESQALVGFISKEAIIDQDYRLMSQRLLIFQPGQQNNTISIQILLTGSVKNPARFHVTLRSPKQAVFGQKSTTVISIKDRESCGNRTYFRPERSLKQVNGNQKSIRGMIQDFNAESDAGLENDFLPSSDQLDIRYSDYLQQKKTNRKCIKGWQIFSKRCYRAFYNKVSWRSANKHCQKLDSFLVSISSKSISNWLPKVFIKLQSYWIGLHRISSSDEWNYTNNEAILYTNWDKGFPKKKGRKRRDCVMVTAKNRWRNRPCDNKRMFFICMRNPQVLI